MKISCRTLIVFLTVFMVCAGCGGGKSPRQHYEKTGGFSYDPPSTWQIIELPGIKNRISRGAPESGFSPNINVVEEEFAGSLSAYADANLQSLEQVFKNLKILSREDFKTQDNEPAVKILIENEQQGSMLRQTFFFFGSGKKKYVVTCTALAKGGGKFDTTFFETMKTFRIH